MLFKLETEFEEQSPTQSNVIPLFTTPNNDMVFGLETFVDQRRKETTFDESEIDRCMFDGKYNAAYKIYLDTTLEPPESFQEFLTARLDIGPIET